MVEACNIMIHEFVPTGPPRFDDEGDQMLGFYYQFTDEAEEPINQLVGPYGDHREVERAAMRAFSNGDF